MRSSLMYYGASLTLLVVLAGCAHPENYRWSENSHPRFPSDLKEPISSNFGSWSLPAVSVYSFTTPAPTAADVSLQDLSDQGQAALIDAMTRSGAKPDDIREALAKPLKTKTPASETSVSTEGLFKRTLVANVTKGWNARPGDRLVWTWVDIRPKNFLFEGYTVVATDNQVLNIEQITNATTASLTGQLGKTSSDTSTSNTSGSPVSNIVSNVLGASAGVSGSVGNTYTTTASINQQYVKLGADIVPAELRIYRESERNLDVAGNTLIALSLRVDPSRLRKVGFLETLRVVSLDVLDDRFAFRSADSMVFDVAINQAPPRCPLTADVTLFYQFRQTRNGRSYVEGQQDAEYASRRSETRQVTIVPADEVAKPSWRVYSSANSGDQIWALDPLQNSLPLDFASVEQASAFAAWLNGQNRTFFANATPSIGKSGVRLTSGNGTPGRWTPIVRSNFVVRPFSKTDADLADECAKMNASYAAVETPPDLTIATGEAPPERR